MTATWVWPWHTTALPCGCVARQDDFSGTWHPLRPCGVHADLLAWFDALRTWPELGGSITHALPEPRRPPYFTAVRCRCCRTRIDLGACDCGEVCPRGEGEGHACARHCLCATLPEDHDDGLDDDIRF